MNTVKSLMIALVLTVSTAAFAKTGKLEETKTAAIDVVIQEQKSGKVLVGFENFGSDQVKIKISDSEGHAVYTARIKKASIMLRRFDLSKMPAGDYSYEVSTGDYSVEKTITK